MTGFPVIENVLNNLFLLVSNHFYGLLKKLAHLRKITEVSNLFLG